MGSPYINENPRAWSPLNCWGSPTVARPQEPDGTPTISQWTPPQAGNLQAPTIPNFDGPIWVNIIDWGGIGYGVPPAVPPNSDPS